VSVARPIPRSRHAASVCQSSANPADGGSNAIGSAAIPVEKSCFHFCMVSVLTITQVYQRSGVASSALRFYEERGLIGSQRAGSGHRRYPRSVLRRIAFIVFAQRIGLTLDEIGAELAKLPADRIPSLREGIGRVSRANGRNGSIKGSLSSSVSEQGSPDASDADVFRSTNASLRIQPIKLDAGGQGRATGLRELNSCNAQRALTCRDPQ